MEAAANSRTDPSKNRIDKKMADSRLGSGVTVAVSDKTLGVEAMVAETDEIVPLHSEINAKENNLLAKFATVDVSKTRDIPVDGESDSTALNLFHTKLVDTEIS